MSIRLMLVDSHRITRDGLRALLTQDGRFEIVAEAEDGHEAIELVGDRRPDLVLTEIALPMLNGIEVTRHITTTWPGVRVLVLSRHQERRYVAAVLAAGASGFVPKDSGIDEVVRAIEALTSGHSYISPKIARGVIEEFVHHAAADEPVGDPSLSPRERQVLQLLAEGHSTKQIAVLLHVSPKTVETHRRQIMIKLDLHSVAELTRYALREGITSL